MLRMSTLSSFNFLHPIGNTPAVCLTRHLPPGHDADVLPLGCGDVRNILFTIASQTGARRFDLTCCDLEPAIIARNILLFTLIIDDLELANFDKIWNIYFHWKIDNDSLDLLKTQLHKLIDLTQSSQTWTDSTYGKTLPIADQGTLKKVADVWRHCIKDASDDAFEFNVDVSGRLRASYWPNDGPSKPNLRCEAPLGASGLEGYAQHYKQHYEGGTCFKPGTPSASPDNINRTFFATGARRNILHPTSDPLLGFHFEAAHASVDPPSDSTSAVANNSSQVLQFVKVQFRTWLQAFREASQSGLVVRSFAGDALSFCHTLQHASKVGRPLTAHHKVHGTTFENLILNPSGYADNGRAPTHFDIIDASDLMGNLGLLNILVAATPLRRREICACLFTEILVRQDTDRHARMQSLFCAELGLLSVLLGVSVFEAWTNATVVADVDEQCMAFEKHAPKASEQGRGQARTCLAWRRLDTIALARTQINAKLLALMLHQIARKMFAHEDVSSWVTKMKLGNIESDWDVVCTDVLQFAIYDFDKLSISDGFVQELQAYMHVFEVHDGDVLRYPVLDMVKKAYRHSNPGCLKYWKNPPPVVAVTIEIPRPALQFLTKIPLEVRGIPEVYFAVREDHPSGWFTVFAVQMGFGHVVRSTDEHEATCSIKVAEDEDGIHGMESLVISGFVPTFQLKKDETALVSVRLELSDFTIGLVSELGGKLTFFETKLGNRKAVHFSRHLPERHTVDPCSTEDSWSILDSMQSDPKVAFPIISGQSPCHGTDLSSFGRTLTLDLPDPVQNRFTVSCKVPVEGAHQLELTKTTTSVTVTSVSAIEVAINVGNLPPLPAKFKQLMHLPSPELRIARHSSYVEVVAPLLNLPAQLGDFPIFPLSLESLGTPPVIQPVCWSMPYVHLGSLPVLEILEQERMQWLAAHVSVMFSPKERAFPEAPIPAEGPALQYSSELRVDFKENIASMFMHASGAQHNKARAFTLSSFGSSEPEILVVISELRLDMANRTLVADAAVLPLSDSLCKRANIKDFVAGLGSLSKPAAMHVREELMQVWKEALPAFAERCRTWSHKTTCEYLTAGRVPIPGGLTNKTSPLCACGEGKLPSSFVDGVDVPLLGEVMSKYATRVAISPCYAMPYTEYWLVDAAGSGWTDRMMSCAKCGKTERVTEAGVVRPLLVCGRCKGIKYCSKECQKAHRKHHKGECNAV